MNPYAGKEWMQDSTDKVIPLIEKLETSVQGYQDMYDAEMMGRKRIHVLDALMKKIDAKREAQFGRCFFRGLTMAKIEKAYENASYK